MTTTAGHPDEATLLGLMDDALEGDERDAAEAHVRGCIACRAEMEHLQRRMRRLEEMLARTDFPLPEPKVVPLRPRARATSRWMRAAAVVLVTLGAAALATPARAWIASWLSGLAPKPRVEAKHTPPPPPVGAPAQSSQVRFPVHGPTFTLTVARTQRAGGVVIRASSSGAATAEVVAGTADLLVLPDGLRIGNAPGSAAEYVVVLPPSVRTVRIRVGDRAPVTLRTATLGARGTRVRLDGTE